jgi:hypothetical protein
MQIRSLVLKKTILCQKLDLTGLNLKLPVYSPSEIYGLLPEDPLKPYDTYEVLARITDGSEIDEYKAGYGKTIITAYARIDGWSVGIVANQRNIVKTETGEMQVGGVIYSDSADKAARFIMNCNQKKIPLISCRMLQDLWLAAVLNMAALLKMVQRWLMQWLILLFLRLL